VDTVSRLREARESNRHLGYKASAGEGRSQKIMLQQQNQSEMPHQSKIILL